MKEMTGTTKETILKTAADMFAKDGVREVSVDDICRRLSISKKTFYQSFPQKEDLVEAISAMKLEARRRQFEQISVDKDTGQVMAGIFELIGKRKTLDRDSRMAMEIEKYYPAVFERQAKERGKAVRENLARRISKGIEEGLLRDDMDVETTLLMICLMHKGMVDYINDKMIIDGPKKSFRSLSATFEDFVSRVMLSDKGMEEYSEIRKNKDNKK